MRINEVFIDFYNEGIFTYLDRFEVPWKTQQIATQLNLVYHTRSGLKYISPLIRSQLNEERELTEARRLVIARAITTINKNKWDRLWNLEKIDYEPLQNYDMSENETIKGSNASLNSSTNTKNINFSHTGEDTTTSVTTGTDTDTTKRTGTEKNERDFSKTIDRTETKGGTDTTTETHSNSDTTTHNINDSVVTNSAINTSGINLNFINGFNTGTIDNNLNDKQTTDTTNTTNSTVTDTATNTDTTQYGHKIETKTVNGGTLDIDETEDTEDNTTITHNTQDSTTHSKDTTVEDTTEYNSVEKQTGTDTIQASNNATNESERTTRKYGNLGVTTSQQMAQSEIELWQWKYFEEVFQDIDKLLTLMIY